MLSRTSHHVASLLLGDGLEVLLPRLGEEVRRPVLVEELQFRSTKGEDSSEDERLDSVRVSLSVGERQGRPPAQGNRSDDQSLVGRSRSRASQETHQEPPKTTHLSILSFSLSLSMSSTRSQVVFSRNSAVGVDLPAPRWSTAISRRKASTIKPNAVRKTCR